MKKNYAPLFLLAGASAMQAQEERPNIIVFLVDDMGLMDTQVPFVTDGRANPVECPLNRWYRTPGMERLAKQGIRFSTFYAQSVSSPSRASLMTGQNAARHRITNWINSETNNKDDYGPAGWNWTGLKKADVTLPRLLQQAGYKTIHVGKAHFGCIGSEGEDPRNIGFDVNVAGSSIGQPGSYYGEHGYGNIKGNKSRAVPGLEKYHGTSTFLSDALTLEAEAQISEAAEENKPFFLYMAHYAVHAPFEEDPRFIGNYASGSMPGDAKAFAALIEGMDKSLNDLLDHLDSLGIAENTMIFFLGDNGSDAPLGDENGHFSSAPLRGKKGSQYEGGTRVPFIAAWAKPDDGNAVQRLMPVKQGAIQEQMGTIMDLFPTVLALAGAKNPEGHAIDGVCLKTQLGGEKDPARPETFMAHFPHQHRSSYFTAYRDGDWKLIYEYHPESPANPVRKLYNLASDPFEDNDLAQKEPARLREMTSAMISRLESEGALYPEDKDGNPLAPVLP